MHVPRLPVQHGEQCHLCFDSIHTLLGKLGLKADVWEWDKERRASWAGVSDVHRDVEERRAGFSFGFCRQNGRNPGIAILTHSNNNK
jgi:hypothetical protein